MNTKELLTINGREYTEAELSDAFDMVANPDDWKAPINKVVTLDDVMYGETIKAAVAFYTGTEARLFPVATKFPRTKWTMRVEAVGYRMGPCGDC